MAYRITKKNIIDYVQAEYGHPVKTENKKKKLANFKPLLQKNYGGINDCTLTAITAMLYYYHPEIDVEKIYEQVELSGKKYFFSNKNGTLPIFSTCIFNDAAKKLNFLEHISKKLFKNIGYNFNDIKAQIDMGRPVLLDISQDGRGYYKNHGVTIVGYSIIENIPFLIIQDNWFLDYSYVDFNKLGKNSSIGW